MLFQGLAVRGFCLLEDMAMAIHHGLFVLIVNKGLFLFYQVRFNNVLNVTKCME